MGTGGRSSSLFFSKMPRPPQCKFANTYNIIPSSACRSNEKKETATIAMDDRCDYRWMVSLYHKVFEY